ncbi:GNAT family N-acetyltransferase [Streptomyces sp. NPDC085529]|uniref:GNAT family N-acetyltransferase n=1 Tax=Streptomyces sp. NPDC085529 TaxID=3365729 RepID=UPI0037CE394D
MQTAFHVPRIPVDDDLLLRPWHIGDLPLVREAAEVAGDRGLGTVGLWPNATDAGRAAVGYWVAGSARGRGVAAAALRTVCTWALDDLGFERLELYVEPWNTASRKTAVQAGFSYEGLHRAWQPVGGERRDMMSYSRLATDPAETVD